MLPRPVPDQTMPGIRPLAPASRFVQSALPGAVLLTTCSLVKCTPDRPMDAANKEQLGIAEDYFCAAPFEPTRAGLEDIRAASPDLPPPPGLGRQCRCGAGHDHFWGLTHFVSLRNPG